MEASLCPEHPDGLEHPEHPEHPDGLEHPEHPERLECQDGLEHDCIEGDLITKGRDMHLGQLVTAHFKELEREDLKAQRSAKRKAREEAPESAKRLCHL